MTDLPIHSADVPVFDCHILISGPDEDGVLTGIVSNLPEVQGTATNERDLLRKLTTDFKATVQRYTAEKRTIPWQPTRQPEPGQSQRWVPVHL